MLSMSVFFTNISDLRKFITVLYPIVFTLKYYETAPVNMTFEDQGL